MTVYAHLIATAYGHTCAHVRVPRVRARAHTHTHNVVTHKTVKLKAGAVPPVSVPEWYAAAHTQLVLYWFDFFILF